MENKIAKKNPNSKYNWIKLVDELRDHEETENDEEVTIEDCLDEEEGHFDEETDRLDVPEYPVISGKDLPKEFLDFHPIFFETLWETFKIKLGWYF